MTRLEPPPVLQAGATALSHLIVPVDLLKSFYVFYQTIVLELLEIKAIVTCLHTNSLKQLTSLATTAFICVYKHHLRLTRRSTVLEIGDVIHTLPRTRLKFP